MPPRTLAESPTLFLQDLRRLLRQYRDLDGHQRATTAQTIITRFEELDDWLAGGGDAPDQWTEKPPVF